jgi:hypothetical protein
MKGLVSGLIAVGVAGLVGLLLFVVFVDRSGETEVTLEDKSFTIDGQSMTCAELYGEPCDFQRQNAFNTWGEGLDKAAGNEDLGSFAREVGPVERAKLTLEACITSMRSDTSVLDLAERVQPQHPGVTDADLFPIWDFARNSVCIPVM